MNHLIVRQVFDVKLLSEQPVFGIQHRLSHFFTNSATPALEMLFDKLAPDEVVVRLEQLEVDLGAVDFNQLTDEQLLRKVISVVEMQLIAAIRSAGLDSTKQNKSGSIFDQWLHFLEFGLLPWYAVPVRWKERFHNVIEALATNATAVEQLRQLLLRSEAARNRLALQHSPEELQVILTLFGGRSLEIISLFLAEFEQILKETSFLNISPLILSIPPGKLRPWFWKWAFEIIALQKRSADGPRLIEQFLKKSLNEDFRLALNQMLATKKVQQNWPVITPFLQTGSLPFSGELKDGTGSSQKGDVKSSNAPKGSKGIPENKKSDESGMDDMQENETGNQVATGSAIDLMSPNLVKTPGKASDTPFDEPQETVQPGKEWHLENAGIVLLNNYLVTFFKNLDLVEGNAFADPESREKAALLLHFLATGIETAAEYELLLPKLLCGIPVEMPLDKGIRLLPDEIEETNALLSAVINQWPAIGNTSPDGLREGFLSRPGKLIRKNDGWRLLIERRTLDVLLDRAPFSIGVIKLPWMKDILWVEW